jgi:hypothetical protein
MALAQVSIELIAIYFHFFQHPNFFVNQILLLSSQIIFRMQTFLNDFEALVREIYVPG